MACPACGKQIEEDSRFCRYCGTRQPEAAPEPALSIGPPSPAGPTAPPAPKNRTGLEGRLRHLFPRHQLQDEFMHMTTIVAFLVAVVGFIFGFIAPIWPLSVTWLLFSIALLLFLMLRESTLSHVRDRGDEAATTRYHARRQEVVQAAPAPAPTEGPAAPGG